MWDIVMPNPVYEHEYSFLLFVQTQLVCATVLEVRVVTLPVGTVYANLVCPAHCVTSVCQDTGLSVSMAADLATVQVTVIHTLETARLG